MKQCSLFLLFLLVVCCFSDSLVTPEQIELSALERLNHKVTYDGAYRSIEYPMGDVPDSIGVCTDLIIRTYRLLGIDLQKLVHEDMKSNFDKYPRNWGATRTDKNIDHRRVPNLQTFFSRHGTSLPISKESLNYKAGDLVTWMLPGNLPHIGVIVSDTGDFQPMVVHNIGDGPVLDYALFWYKITGHYRYNPRINE